MLVVALKMLLLLAPLVVGLGVALPRRGLPRRELDLEAVVDVVDHGAGARHGLHGRVAADGVGAVVVVIVGGGLLTGEPAAAEPPHDAGCHGQDGDHREHGEHRAERAPRRRGVGRVRAQDGVGGGR
nr:unnamed protein product [Digitaria exilis]